MPRLLTKKSYERQLLKFRKKHPELREQYFKTLTILESNPFHPSLRLHKLHGRLKEYHSVSVNLQYRIMIDFVIKDDMILLISIRGHDEMGMWEVREWEAREYEREKVRCVIFTFASGDARNIAFKSETWTNIVIVFKSMRSCRR